MDGEDDLVHLLIEPVSGMNAGAFRVTLANIEEIAAVAELRPQAAVSGSLRPRILSPGRPCRSA